jgi:hypothetical protein
MKPKTVIILAVVFLILQSTFKIWAIYLSWTGMFVFLGLTGIFLMLTVLLFFQLFLVFKERFKEKRRIISSGILATVLSVVAFFPLGLIDRDIFRAPDVLVAWQEGGGNCHTFIAFKEDNTFVETAICFGDSELTGTYSISGDTIYFGAESPDEYANAFAVLHRNEADTFSGLSLHHRFAIDAYPMRVSLDKLSKK